MKINKPLFVANSIIGSLDIGLTAILVTDDRLRIVETASAIAVFLFLIEFMIMFGNKQKRSFLVGTAAEKDGTEEYLVDNKVNRRTALLSAAIFIIITLIISLIRILA